MTREMLTEHPRGAASSLSSTWRRTTSPSSTWYVPGFDDRPPRPSWPLPPPLSAREPARDVTSYGLVPAAQVFEYLDTDLKKYMDLTGRGPAHPLPRSTVKVRPSPPQWAPLVHTSTLSLNWIANSPLGVVGGLCV